MSPYTCYCRANVPADGEEERRSDYWTAKDPGLMLHLHPQHVCYDTGCAHCGSASRAYTIPAGRCNLYSETPTYLRESGVLKLVHLSRQRSQVSLTRRARARVARLHLWL